MTIGVGEDVEIILSFDVDTGEVEITVDDNVCGLMEVEYTAELLDSSLGFEVVGTSDIVVLVGTIELEECLIDK